MGLLKDLPKSNSREKGWPWTEETPEDLYKNKDWPKISIVIPSFNQGQFIEETIRSIILQNYPNIELLIIDGGSNDATLDIIKQYDKWIHYWVSETDNGQSHAINKGLKIISGEIFNWINSDDLLVKNSLYEVAMAFESNPGFEIVRGRLLFFDHNTQYIKTVHNSACLEESVAYLPYFIIQPSTFVKTSLFKDDRIGVLNEELDYVFDLEWMLKYYLINGQTKICSIEQILAHFRLHDSSKTVSQISKFVSETAMLYRCLFDLFYINAKSPKLWKQVAELQNPFNEKKILKSININKVYSYYLLSQMEDNYYPEIRKNEVSLIHNELTYSYLALKGKLKALKIYLLATLLPSSLFSKIRKS